MTNNAKGKPLDESDLRDLRSLIEREGEREVLQHVRLSRSALHRALAGLPVSEGTRAIVRRDIASLTAPR